MTTTTSQDGEHTSLGRVLPPAGSRLQAGRGRRLRGELLRYTAIGVVMTLAYLALYAVLRPALGAQPANLLAWVLTAAADTAANRRITFGQVGPDGAVRTQVQGMLVFGIGLGLTSGALLVLAALQAHPATWVQAAVLVAANLLAGLVRFVLLRTWVFAR